MIGPVVAGVQRRLAIDHDGVLASEAEDARVTNELDHLAQLDVVGIAIALNDHVLGVDTAFDHDG